MKTNDLDEIARLHATVKGWVQGVGFRYFVLETAVELGVTGWVRNCWDGSVEVLAEGMRTQLEKLLAALEQGPPSARIMHVDDIWDNGSGEFSSFHIRKNG